MICDMLNGIDCRKRKAGCKPALRTGRGLQAASTSKPEVAQVDSRACPVRELKRRELLSAAVPS
jgi:hypothetical protein